MSSRSKCEHLAANHRGRITNASEISDASRNDVSTTAERIKCLACLNCGIRHENMAYGFVIIDIA